MCKTSTCSRSASGGRARSGAAGALGKDARIVDSKPREPRDKPRDNGRLERFAAKRKAATLLRDVAPKTAKRISDCCYVAHAHEVTLSEVTHVDGEKSAQWCGIVTCSNVWACPVCSARIAEERRAEMNALLAWARGAGKAVVMLTLTHRHTRRDALPDNLDAMKRALKAYRQSRCWRALGVTGSVTATEVTHGQANGWHVHYHLLIVMDQPGPDAVAALEATRAEWSRSLRKAGLTGNRAAFQVQPASSAGNYVAKFAAADEIALGHKKQGRGGSRSPWQLLADARDGDAYAGELFKEYAVAFAGRCQLVWSRGLKDRAGVEEAVAAEAEAEAAERSAPVVVKKWLGWSEEWRQARRRRVALTDAVEQGGDLARAEFGPTDAERWRERLRESVVLEP